MNFDFQLLIESWPLFAKGLAVTIMISTISISAGFCIGVAVALMRLTDSRILRLVTVTYIEIIRDTPFLIQVYLVFFVLPALGLRLDPLSAGILCLTIYGSAYFAENVRGAILAIPKGQSEAARSLGLSYWRIQRSVIFPQMLGYLIPTTTNLTLSLIKDTAILSVITVPELTYMAQVMIGEAFAPVEGFTVIALLYWGLNAIVAAVMKKWEVHSCRYLNPDSEPRKEPELKPEQMMRQS